MIDEDSGGLPRGGRGHHTSARGTPRLEPNGVAGARGDGRSRRPHLVVYVPAAAAPTRAARPRGQRRRPRWCSARPIDDRACQVKGIVRSARAPRPRPSAPWCAAQWDGVPRQPRADRHSARGDADLGDVAGRRDPRARQRALQPDAGPGGRERRLAMSRRTSNRSPPASRALLPAQLFTCSLDGIPNAAYLSHVDYVDRDARRAVVPVLQQEPPQHRREPAARWCMVIDPDTGQGWLLRLRFVRSETVGPALRADGAAHRGDRLVLRAEGHLQAARGRHLRGAVDRAGARGSRRRAGARPRPDAAAPADAVFTMKALQDLAGRIHRADSLETLRRLDPARARRELRLQALDDPRAGRRGRRPGHDRHARVSARTAPAPKCGSAKASPAWWPKRASRSASRG